MTGNIWENLNGGGGGSRSPYVPEESPFSDNAARDAWAASNLNKLFNNTINYTFVVVGAYQYEWGGTDTPNAYDTNYWINVSAPTYTAGPGLTLADRQFSLDATYIGLLDGATSSNTPGTLVRRDGTGIIDASLRGTLLSSGNLEFTEDNQFSIGSNSARVSRYYGQNLVDDGSQVLITNNLVVDGSLTFNGIVSGVLKSSSGSISASTIVNEDIANSAGITDNKLAIISTPGKVDNSATTARSENSANSIVARDENGNFYSNKMTGGVVFNLLEPNADNIVSIGSGTARVARYYGVNIVDDGIDLTVYGGFKASGSIHFYGLTGGVLKLSPASDKTVSSSEIIDADISPSAAIADTKLATISTAGKVANSATTATASAGFNTIALRDGAGNLTSNNFIGNLTGNSSSADSLKTSRSIYGNLFNGTQDLTQIIGAQFGGTGNGFTQFSGPTTTTKTFTLPNSSATILTSSNAVTVPQGGTGITTLAQGDILYASDSNTLTALPKNTSGQNYLANTGVNNNPQWSKIDLGNGVSGTLPVGSGGTGQTTYTNGQLLIGNTTGNTLTKATLTAGAGVIVTNGPGSINVRIGQDVATGASPTFANMTLSGVTAGRVAIFTATKNFTSAEYTPDNSSSAFVQRDSSGGFSAGVVTLSEVRSSATNTLAINIGGNATTFGGQINSGNIRPISDNTSSIGFTSLGYSNIYVNNITTPNSGNPLNLNQTTNNAINFNGTATQIYTQGGLNYGTLKTYYIGFGGFSAWETNVILQGPNVVTAQAKCFNWGTYSDKNLKDNIKHSRPENDLKLSLSIGTYDFFWKKGQGDNLPGMTPKLQIGYIAQDVAKHMPSACIFDNDGVPTGVDYAKVSRLHGGAIKALYQRDAELNHQIKLLKKRICDLETIQADYIRYLSTSENPWRKTNEIPN